MGLTTTYVSLPLAFLSYHRVPPIALNAAVHHISLKLLKIRELGPITWPQRRLFGDAVDYTATLYKNKQCSIKIQKYCDGGFFERRKAASMGGSKTGFRWV